MSVELGEFGIFRRADETTAEVAQEVERLGFGALWLGGSPSGDLETIEKLLDATESIPIATGIVNMWRDTAGTVAASYHLWSLGVNATPVGESVVSSRRLLLWSGSPRRSESWFGIGGRRVMRTG